MTTEVIPALRAGGMSTEIGLSPSHTLNDAAIPSRSFVRRSASESEFHAVNFGPVLLPRKTARYVLLVLMV